MKDKTLSEKTPEEHRKYPDYKPSRPGRNYPSLLSHLKGAIEGSHSAHEKLREALIEEFNCDEYNAGPEVLGLLGEVLEALNTAECHLIAMNDWLGAHYYECLKLDISMSTHEITG